MHLSAFIALIIIVPPTYTEDPKPLLEDYKVINLPTSSGIYFEEIAPLKIAMAEWKLVTGIDVAHLLATKPDIPRQLAQVKTGCEDGQSPTCPVMEIGASLMSRLAQAEKYEDILYRSLGHHGDRRRRGAPLGFIGSLSHTLFGTLSEEDAEYYNKEIDKLYTDQRQLSELLANQTHIVRADLQETFDKIETLNAFSQNLSEEVKKIVTGINQIEQEERAERTQLAIAAWSSQASRLVDEYLFAISTLVTAITFAKTGTIHPDIISPKQMMKAALKIEQTTTFKIPLTQEELRREQLKDVADVHMAYTKGRIVVVIRIPLIGETSYHLFQAYPAPTFSTHTHGIQASIFIQPSIPYIAYNQEESKYIQINENYLHKCKSHHQQYICPPGPAIENAKNEPTCEISILQHQAPQEWNLCDIRVLKRSTSTIQELTQQNTWLAYTEELMPLRVQCNSHSAGYEPIIGLNIIKLKEKCTATIGRYTLLTKQTTTSKIQKVYEAPAILNLTNILPNITAKHAEFINASITEIKGARQLNSHHQVYSTALKQIEGQARLLTSHSRTARLGEITTYTTGGIGIVTVILILGIAIIVTRKNKGTQIDTHNQPSQDDRQHDQNPIPSRSTFRLEEIIPLEGIPPRQPNRAESLQTSGMPSQKAITLGIPTATPYQNALIVKTPLSRNEPIEIF